jgi:hypothetical protein
VVVVFTHVSEALHLFPWMHWGLEHSIGHYLDFFSAVLGLTLFPIGYLLHALRAKHHARRASVNADRECLLISVTASFRCCPGLHHGHFTSSE